MSTQDTTLPPLPEWSLRDDLGGLVPSDIRSELKAYARAAIATQAQQQATLQREIDRLNRLVGYQKTVIAALAQRIPQKPCLVSGACKHGSWCTETYCQEHCQFVKAEPQPVHRRHTDAEALSCADRLNRSFPPSSLKDEAADHIRELVAASAEPQPEREPLTDAQIEKLREATFSTCNPFCPCDSKSMRKAVRAAERAHGIGTKGGDK